MSNFLPLSIDSPFCQETFWWILPFHDRMLRKRSFPSIPCTLERRCGQKIIGFVTKNSKKLFFHRVFYITRIFSCKDYSLTRFFVYLSVTDFYSDFFFIFISFSTILIYSLCMFQESPVLRHYSACIKIKFKERVNKVIERAKWKL